MQDLAHQRCFNHARREAVARCLECGHFYCRECITEHESRMICASCLKTISREDEQRRTRFVKLGRFMQCMLSVLLLWFIFYLMGSLLLKLPSQFHDGTLWKIEVEEES